MTVSDNPPRAEAPTDIESVVVGTVLAEPAAAALVPELALTGAEFVNAAARAAWGAITALHERGAAIDVHAVLRLVAEREQDAACPRGELEAMRDAATRVDVLPHHAEQLRHEHTARRLRALALSMASQASNLSLVRELLEQASVELGAHQSRDGSMLRHITADKLETRERTFDDELVEGVIGKATLAVLYGDSNSGKTFLAIDIAACVEHSAPWMGRNVDGGLVLYLATEAAASVELRAAAYRKRHKVELAGLVIVQSPINLFDENADVSRVVALARHYERLLKRRVVLVVGDTLARIAAGANENSGEDMSVVMRNADRIREALSATFLWIHHVGKDTAKGMRGWSGMRAAIDTEVEITADEATGRRCAEITKQRDLPGKGERIGFELEPIRMGRNKWGRERTSCTVASIDAPPRQDKAKRVGEVAGAIVEFLTTRGTGCKRSELVRHFAGRHHRGAVYKEVRKLLDLGKLHEVAGIVALVKQGAKA